MNTEIIVAIIGAGAAIIAALIAGIFALIAKTKNKKPTDIKLRQKQSGTGNTQIGIQNNYGGSQDER